MGLLAGVGICEPIIGLVFRLVEITLKFMSEIRGGFTMWARQTVDSDIFYSKPDKWFKVWFFLVNHVNHTDNKHFQRGTNFVSYSGIQEKTGATKAQIDMFMRWSKKCGMLTTRKTTRGIIITVSKYGVFQDSDKYKNDTKNEMKTTQKRHRNDTINKNDNNDNKIQATTSVAYERPKFNDLGKIIIEEFTKFNPACGRYYGNTTQRAACDFLLKEYGLEEVLKRITILPKTNKTSFFPSITTPVQLRDKWVALQDAADRRKNESKIKNPVAFV